MPRPIIYEKREKLSELAGPLRDRGIDAEIDVLSGTTPLQITRLVSSGAHDLVVRGAKGRGSRRKQGVGTTAIRLLRECPYPVLLVAPGVSPSYSQVMACVDTSSDELVDAVLNDRVVTAATRLIRCYQSQLSIVHAWSIYGEEFLLMRTKDIHFQDLTARVRNRSEEKFYEFLQAHGRIVSGQSAFIRKGRPAIRIPAFATEKKVDWIVMGAISRSWLSGMLLGSTAERVLSQIGCSVLVIKPGSLVSPVNGSHVTRLKSVA
ncbi:Universal stress protein E [Stieleria maiorica]|uniref:Universal stress protein E n=1 Tax=Stieleria maiorica TaxID=2795974 RepID=A0A5B9M9D2_9BACT|nr:universal stress protein [Stieleria maiorica]QEF97851.1 Universal stress protein E [Stieleria maiorica]